MALEEQAFELRPFVEQAFDLVTAQATAKNLELAVLVDSDVPVAVRADDSRIRQVLVNLLTNAVKFTEHGEIVIAVHAQPLPDGYKQLHFSVRDSGIGIAPENLSRVFHAFTQADGTTTRKYGGTGLGLTISRHLVEMMGGEIWVESTLGAGSTFHFTVRTQVAETPPSPEATLQQLKGRNVLIVDDNDTNCKMLTLQTRHWGMEPVAVTSGTGSAGLCCIAARRGRHCAHRSADARDGWSVRSHARFMGSMNGHTMPIGAALFSGCRSG